MEASFRLLKHGNEVTIPQSFDTLSQARVWVDKYYDWYNNIHRHSGICYITPSQCFDGKGDEMMSRRNMIIEKFFERHQKQKALVESTGKFKRWRRGCGQNPGHLNEVIYGIYSPTNYCSIKTV